VECVSKGRLGLIVVLLGSLLVGCAVEAPKPVLKPAQDPQQVRRQSIENLLALAERALQADRLASPAHDNAADRYRAVLRLDPQNPQARTGLQLVVMRYVDLARQALAKSRAEQADYFLARARGVGGVAADNSLLAELQKNIADARASQTRSTDYSRFDLDRQQLSAKTSELVALLVGIAERVRDTDETLLIVARTDSEGRWLYQQMRRAVPGYRLRGDIQIGKVPHILLQAPIE
jgi:hypothetical protein